MVIHREPDALNKYSRFLLQEQIFSCCRLRRQVNPPAEEVLPRDLFLRWAVRQPADRGTKLIEVKKLSRYAGFLLDTDARYRVHEPLKFVLSAGDLPDCRRQAGNAKTVTKK
jgi:hypothetical protein